MGCGSSQAVAPEQNAIRNGDVKRESPRPNEQEHQPQPEVIRQETPKEKRKDSAKSSSSSSSSSRSSSAKSKRSRPETAPGGDAPAQIENKQPAQETEAPQSNNNKDSEGPVVVTTVVADEVEKVEEAPDETTTQGEGNTEGNEKPAEEQEREKPNFSEDVLREFVEVENQIQTLEGKGAENEYPMKHARLVELYKKLSENTVKVQQLKAQTAKEYQDVVDVSAAYNVRSFFVSADQLNAEVAKERSEYVEALNKQEIAEQELESLKQQYQKLYNEVVSAKKDQDELQSLRNKEEELLGRIFNDSYGSDKEWKLEMELELLAERKTRISAANTRWHGASVCLTHATKQLSWSARRWAQISSHNVTLPVVKYTMVAETRNHIIAAIQNISSAYGSLKPVTAPYCTPEDLEVLKAITNSIFNDVNVPASYQKTYNVLCVIFSKCSSLLQWVNRVVEETISKDLAEVKKEFHEKYYELKEERMNLIKSKVKEKLGVELEMEVKRDEFVDDDSSAEEADIAKPGAVAKEEGDDQAPEPEDKEGLPAEAPPSGDGEAPAEAEAGGDSADAPPKPVPLSELAPPPNQEDLFGNIDQLKKQHEEELAEFEKQQELNKTRVEQGLQEKLRARRSRRRKMQAQEAEASALSGGEGSSEPPPPSEMGL